MEIELTAKWKIVVDSMGNHVPTYYRAEYIADSDKGKSLHKGELVPAKWVSLNSYLGSPAKAIETIIEYELHSSEELFTMSQYITRWRNMLAEFKIKERV